MTKNFKKTTNLFGFPKSLAGTYVGIGSDPLSVLSGCLLLIVMSHKAQTYNTSRNDSVNWPRRLMYLGSISLLIY